MDLDGRISAAFSDTARSEQFPALISEVEATAELASAVAERSRLQALDPASTVKDVSDTRRAMEDAAFRRDRLLTAASKLTARHAEVKASEENARRQLAYDEAVAARDALAVELRETYPALVARLAALMTRVAASDREILHINRSALPDGAARILVAELIARDLQGFTLPGSAIHSVVVESIVNGLRLPAFVPNQFAPYDWPPRTTMLGSVAA